MENELKDLAEEMFAEWTPSNPIPFANGLVKGCKMHGSDYIQSDQGKMILFTLMQQAYGTAFQLDSFKEFQRLMDVRKDERLKEKFAEYCAYHGYSTNKIYSNETGLYAHINGWVSKNCPHFTQVLQGGTTVRLSYKDLQNESIVENFKFE